MPRHHDSAASTTAPRTGSGRRTLARLRKTWLALPLVALLMMGFAAPTAQANAAPFEPFAPGSPFRSTIPSSATVDSNSAAMVARLAQNNGMYANLVEFGIPIYHATSSSPRYRVSCTMNWGKCPFDGYQVPIPADAKPHPGSDGAMVVVDSSTRQVFEFWQARRSGSSWSTSWGGVASLDGDGWSMHGNSTGSGASRLGGVIQVAEIERGEIRHALALQSNNVCANVFRSPAVKTDGRSTRSDCIPEGARVRLDPSVNLDSLQLSPAARTVAKAMQTYGGYVVDVSGAPLSVSFEMDTTARSGSIGTTYQQAGLRWDYDHLAGVPWNRLQVLAHSSAPATQPGTTTPRPSSTPTPSPSSTPTRSSSSPTASPSTQQSSYWGNNPRRGSRWR